MRQIFISMLLFLAIVGHATAEEKVIPRKLIDRLQGEVRVLMPCNWDKTKPVDLIGFYGDGMARKPLTKSSWSGTKEYLVLTVADEDRTGLNEVVVDFAVTRQQCPDGFGFRSLTR